MKTSTFGIAHSKTTVEARDKMTGGSGFTPDPDPLYGTPQEPGQIRRLFKDMNGTVELGLQPVWVTHRSKWTVFLPVSEAFEFALDACRSGLFRVSHVSCSYGGMS